MPGWHESATWDDVLTNWRELYDVEAGLLVFDVPAALGELICKGQWPLDMYVVPLAGRMRSRQPIAANFPAEFALKQYRAELRTTPTTATQHDDAAVGSGNPSSPSSPANVIDEAVGHAQLSVNVSRNVVPLSSGYRGIRGFVFSPDVLVRALIASRHVRRQAHLRASGQDYLKFALPCDARKVLDAMEKVGFRHPSGGVLLKARVRFDLASMLLYSRSFANRQAFRQLGFDKSPQVGREIFGIRESILIKDDLGPPTVMERQLALYCMAHHYTSTPDIAQALLHAACLDYGPDYDDLLR